jgi:hypothetical protein
MTDAGPGDLGVVDPRAWRTHRDNVFQPRPGVADFIAIRDMPPQVSIGPRLAFQPDACLSTAD